MSEEGQSGLKREWTCEGGVRMLLFERQEAGQRGSVRLSRPGLKEIRGGKGIGKVMSLGSNNDIKGELEREKGGLLRLDHREKARGREG